MRALGLAYHWQRLLDEGRFTSITEIAAAESIDGACKSDRATDPGLAPDIVVERVGFVLERLIRREKGIGLAKRIGATIVEAQRKVD